MSYTNFQNIWQWSPSLQFCLRHPFPGVDIIERNYSQSWQDLFVLTVLQGQRKGSYLEVGGHVPVSNNNTCLLQEKFGWRGVSIELDASHMPAWQQHRPDSQFVIADALAIDYTKALPLWFDVQSRRIDYLQLDIDPSSNTLAVLKRLPLDDWRFSVITFETDAYTQDIRARDESRVILAEQGYVLVAQDVSVLYPPVSPEPIPFEDWWVDPQVVDAHLIHHLQRLSQQSRLPQHLLFNNGEV